MCGKKFKNLYMCFFIVGQLMVLSQIEMPYIPKPKQLQFHESDATECYFGGAKGPGKSRALVEDAKAYALEFAGSDPHLFRENYDILRDTLIKEFKDWTPKELYEFNEQAHEARFRNGSVIKFRYCASYEDALQYDGRSIPYLGIDETQKHLWKSVQQLMTCMRSAKGWPVLFRGTGNPGGIGHAAIRNRYILPTEYGKKKYTDPVTGNLIEFIPANVYDGVLTEVDPAYVRRLENLPEKRKKALLYGDWDIFEGQYFANFGPHMEQEPWKIPPHILQDRAYGSLDYGPGLNGTHSFGFWYVSEEGIPHRLYTVYRQGATASELAEELYDHIGSFYWTSGVFPKRAFCDHNIFNSTRMEQATDGAPVDFLKKKFGGKTEWVPANKNRINGWQTVLDYFSIDNLTGKPKMYYWPVFNSHFAEYFPLLVHNDDRPEDVLRCDIDHVADETRYFLVGIGIQGVAGSAINGKKHKREDINTILREKMERNEIGVIGI